VNSPIGILGGTFDPIHYGHLRLAQEALEQCNLSEVRFIPGGTPPHRSAPHAAAQQRLDMVRLAASDNTAFIVDEREIHRNDPCYTVDTLTELRAELGTQQPLCLLMGGDAFLSLHTWHAWEKLFELAHIVVMQRPGRKVEAHTAETDPGLHSRYHQHVKNSAAALHATPAGAVLVIDMPALDISATDIRQRCAEGKNIRYLLPDTVADYIHSHHLYSTHATH
jgi:nicotinate-nucleotide adenylyltransferase